MRGKSERLSRKAVTAVEFILLAGIAVFIVVLVSTYTLKSVFSPTLNQSNQTLGNIEERTACYYVNCADTCTQAVAGAPWAWRNHSAVCESGTCIYRGVQNCTNGCLNGECVKVAPRVGFTWAQLGGGFCQYVQFTSTSTDPDSAISKYYWSIGNGTTVGTTAGSLLQVYPVAYPSQYNVTLEVVDNSGLTNATTRQMGLCDDLDWDGTCDPINPDGSCPA